MLAVEEHTDCFFRQGGLALRPLRASTIVNIQAGPARRRRKRLEKGSYNVEFAVRLCTESHAQWSGERPSERIGPKNALVCGACNLAKPTMKRKAKWRCWVCDVPLCETCDPLWHSSKDFIKARQKA